MGLFGKKRPKVDEGERCYMRALDSFAIGDTGRALEYLNKSVELKNRHGMSRLARYYFENYPDDANKLLTAAQLMEQAEAAGAMVDNYDLGRLYDKLERPQEAFQRYLAAAKSGEKESVFQVAYRYAYGKGVERDYKEAANWYEKAVELDVPGAYNNLANLYNSGRGVEKDQRRAMELYIKAAELDGQNTPGNLALGYFKGEEPWPQDDELALKYANMGDTQSCRYVYAMLLCAGRGGFEEDPINATEIMQELSRDGYKLAQDKGLGFCLDRRTAYVRGLVSEAMSIMEEDPEDARKKLEEIKEMGFSVAVRDGMAAYRKIKSREYDKEYLKAKEEGDTFTVRRMADRGSALACQELLEAFLKNMEQKRPGWSQSVGRGLKYCDTCLDITGEERYSEIRGRILSEIAQEAEKLMESGSPWAAYSMLAQVESYNNVQCLRLQVKAAREMGDKAKLADSLESLVDCSDASQDERQKAHAEFVQVKLDIKNQKE